MTAVIIPGPWPPREPTDMDIKRPAVAQKKRQFGDAADQAQRMAARDPLVKANAVSWEFLLIERECRHREEASAGPQRRLTERELTTEEAEEAVRPGVSSGVYARSGASPTRRPPDPAAGPKWGRPSERPFLRLAVPNGAGGTGRAVIGEGSLAPRALHGSRALDGVHDGTPT